MNATVKTTVCLFAPKGLMTAGGIAKELSEAIDRGVVRSDDYVRAEFDREGRIVLLIVKTESVPLADLPMAG